MMLVQFRSRKYLQRIVWTLIVFIVAILCVFASTLYWKMKQSTMHIQMEANRKVFAQVKYNVEYMDEILKNLMMSLYFDNEVIPILYSKTFSYGDIAIKLAKLDKVADSSTYLHSIILYNYYTDTYLSTNRKFQDNLHGEIGRFELQLGNKANVQKMKLVPMKITADTPNAIDFFSYMMYDERAEQSKQSKLILNVKPEWIFNNIKVINSLAYDKSSSVLLMDGSGVLYTNDNREADFLPERIAERIKESRAELETFTYGRGSHKSIVTVMSLGEYNWKAIGIQSYDYAFKEVNGIRNMLMAVTILFLVLSAVIAFIISTRLYRPVDSMVRQVRGTLPHELKSAGQKDEWSYLAASYASMADKADLAERHHLRNRKIVENFHFRSMLSRGTELTEEEFRSWLTEHRLPLDAAGPFMIGVCKIDRFERQMLQASASEQRIYKFALGNIAEELLSRHGKPVWIEMGDNQYVFLCSLPSLTLAGDSIKETIRELQQVIQTYYHLSTTFSLARPFGSCTGMADAYQEALQLIQYRMLLGSAALITTELVRAEDRHENLHHADHIEKQMTEHLRLGNSQELKGDIDHYFEYASKLTYSQFMNAVLHMTVTVTKTISEMNEHRLRPLDIDIRAFHQEVLKQETAEEMKELFYSLAEQLSDQEHPAELEKADMLARTMKDMIAENSMDPDFSLNAMAQLLKMSSAYIGRQFKQSTGMTVTEYMNEYRLERALELLETKDITINEVMELSGYRSQSYFFKLFKSKYGTSPKNYRLHKVMTPDKY